jgi:cytoskeletal protein CcmA (bactofilin family)
MPPASPSPAPASNAAVARPAEASPARRFTDVATGGSRFGPTLHIRGSITGTDAVEIAGQVEGPIEVEGLLHVAEGARVTGPITATDAVIEGELQGRLAARGRVELRASAKVRAEVHAPTVAIAEGCFFDGRIHMGGESEGGPTHFREKRRRRGRGGHPEAHPATETGGDKRTAAPAAPVSAEPAAAQPVVAADAAPAATQPAEPASPAPAAATPVTPAIRPLV